MGQVPPLKQLKCLATWKRSSTWPWHRPPPAAGPTPAIGAIFLIFDNGGGAEGEAGEQAEGEDGEAQGGSARWEREEEWEEESEG